jgi:teichuronic acid biosynthesis glycosyltransferase TuaG
MLNDDHFTETVSIVIPTYNRLHETSRAIDSCLVQSHNEIQIIVVDDGGNPSEFNELKSQYSKEPKVTFYSIQHTGHPGKVRNVGIQKSDGRWIAFLDSDDVWEYQKLEKQLAAARVTNARAICANAFKGVSEALLISERKSKFFSTNDLLSENIIVTSSVLISRELLEEIGGTVDRSNAVGTEDFATWLRVSTKVDWLYLPEGLVRYELHSEDSLKFSTHVSQIFSHTFGLIDFVEWQKTQNGISLRLTRLLLLFIPLMIKLDLFLNRSKSRRRESNPEE